MIQENIVIYRYVFYKIALDIEDKYIVFGTVMIRYHRQTGIIG